MVLVTCVSIAAIILAVGVIYLMVYATPTGLEIPIIILAIGIIVISIKTLIKVFS